MTIPKVKTSVRVTGADSAGKRILTAAKKSNWEGEAHMTGMIGELSEITEKLSGAIKQSKAENLRDEKDVVRDEKVRGMHHLINGYHYHPFDSVKNAAGKVEKTFSKYGVSIVGERYDIESSYINSMITDFAEPEMEEAIGELPGFEQVVEELKAAQSDFESADEAWLAGKTDDCVSATEVKKELLKVINGKLVLYLRAMTVLDNATYGGLASKVAEIVTETNRGLN